MSYKALIIFLVVLLNILVGVVVYIKQQPVPHDAEYIGSSKCQTCHQNEHTDWKNSLHAKMMRRVEQPNAVVADLESENCIFNADEVVWAIGSKWEQQFMGEAAGTETLLPGAWLTATKQWKNTGWDGWQVPEPVQRCHGCHTVGLDVETGKFVEPSIGCESCHGPGSWHANTVGFGQIVSSLDEQVCGQCHTRGRSIDGRYFFPVGYKPGLNLADFMKEEEPDYIQNSSKWWGNGHPRKRHQELYSWRQGGHANSLKSLKENYRGQYGKVTSQCLSCHAGEAIADNQSKNYLLKDVQYGITCSVCHNTHNELNKPKINCSSCHKNGAFYHKQVKDHIPCPIDANVQCQQCHMPLTVMNGGGYTLHSHRPDIIRPSDTRDFGVPNSCANGGCHEGRSVEWLEQAYQNHYEP